MYAWNITWIWTKNVWLAPFFLYTIFDWSAHLNKVVKLWRARKPKKPKWRSRQQRACVVMWSTLEGKSLTTSWHQDFVYLLVMVLKGLSVFCPLTFITASWWRVLGSKRSSTCLLVFTTAFKDTFPSWWVFKEEKGLTVYAQYTFFTVKLFLLLLGQIAIKISLSDW